MNSLDTKDVLKALIRETIKNIADSNVTTSIATKKCACGCSPSVIREAYRGMSLGAIIDSYYADKCNDRLRLAASFSDGTAKRRALAEKRDIQQINHLMRRVTAAGDSSIRGLLGDPDALRYRLAELTANPFIKSADAHKIKAEIRSLVLEVNDNRLLRHLRDVFHSLDECACMQGQRETPTGMSSPISFYRPGTPEFFSNARKLRSMYHQDQYSPANDWEAELLVTDIGDWDMFDGEAVPLDFPFIEVDGEWDEPCDTCSSHMYEAKYKGKEVELGKPKRGSGGRAYVYVRDPKSGNVRKVSFGSSMPDAMGDSDTARARRRSFGNRHNCAKKKDRTQAGYWSCRATKFFGRNSPGWW
jgi:hypothetical protein